MYDSEARMEFQQSKSHGGGTPNMGHPTLNDERQSNGETAGAAKTGKTAETEQK
jgi:hypothetical protein